MSRIWRRVPTLPTPHSCQARVLADARPLTVYLDRYRGADRDKYCFYIISGPTEHKLIGEPVNYAESPAILHSKLIQEQPGTFETAEFLAGGTLDLRALNWTEPGSHSDLDLVEYVVRAFATHQGITMNLIRFANCTIQREGVPIESSAPLADVLWQYGYEIQDGNGNV